MFRRLMTLRLMVGVLLLIGAVITIIVKSIIGW